MSSYEKYRYTGENYGPERHGAFNDTSRDGTAGALDGYHG